MECSEYGEVLNIRVDLIRLRALILTVDSNVGDHRQSTEKLKGTRGNAEPGIKTGPFVDDDRYHDARQNWDDLIWLKELAKGIPIYLKGVCHIDVSYWCKYSV